MGFLSHKVESSNLKAGDHIYTWRTGFIYSHHGIYVGGDKVVHFTQDQEASSSITSSFSSSVSKLSPTCLDFADCGFKKDGSGVTMSCLNCFLGNGSLYRFEYGVSQCVFIAKVRSGTCTTAKSDDPEAVIHRAMHLLHNGFGKYNWFENNCEDFALYCKTGLIVCSQGQPSSGQALSVLGVPVAAILSLPLRIFSTSPIVYGAVTAASYTLSKYAHDIGVRSDTIKVKVEDIAGDEDTRDEVDGSDTRGRKRRRGN